MTNKNFIAPAGWLGQRAGAWTHSLRAAMLHAKNMAQKRRAAGSCMYYCLYLALLQDPPLH